MELRLLEEIVEETNYINSLLLMAYLLIMIKPFILLILEIIVLLNGNAMRQWVKLLQMEIK
jgi:hypothetical protein